MQSLELLKELIPFPSVSSTSNADVSRWVETQLTSRGFQTECLEYTDKNGVLKVCVSGRKGPRPADAPSERGMAYFCHSDVVPVESWSFPDSGPWEPWETPDRLYGRGSCDMKGSLACMLAAVDSVAGQDYTAPLYVVCTADEEIGLLGAQAMVADSAMYREIVAQQPRTLIGEPTLLEVVHAHKGGRAFRVSSQGIAAHSSTGKGINANFAMIPFLADVKDLCEQLKDDPAWQDDRFSPPTINLNLGINDHTHAINITPAQSVCTIYFRTMPAIDADSLSQQITALAEKHKLEITPIFVSHPMFTDPDSDYVRELLVVTGRAASHTVSYGTDGSCLQELNDVVVLGPGDIRQAHTDDEWVSLEQLRQGTDLYARLVQRWCGGSE